MINIFRFAEYEYFFFLEGGDLFITLEVVAGNIIAAGGQQYAFRFCREGFSSSGGGMFHAPTWLDNRLV
jgi:hypothetical protein